MRMSCVAITLSSLLVPQAAADQGTHARYIAFFARPSSVVVGHSFVEISTGAKDGTTRADATIGLYPARYPRMDAEALVNAPGKIMKTADDRRDRATASFSVAVSEATYRKALAHVGYLRSTWRRYDLATENCNALVFEFADRLGLEFKRDMLDLPENIVRGMASSNDGRFRASWRPAKSQ